jgi:glycosyltransferase involved in cell wall biosynthesis
MPSTRLAHDQVVKPALAPSVSVVIPTHDRPEEVRRAIASVLAQEYAGALDVVVVHDRAEPDLSLVRDGDRPVRVLANDRRPGLAGSRNTGILAVQGDLVAFCDDDDTWLPGKLGSQVTALREAPGAELVTTAMVVDYRGAQTVRLAGSRRIGHDAFVRSRMAMLHSSSFVFRRAALLDGIGLVDETLPQSMAEDWDLLLRASARTPVVHVDRPLVRVAWGGTSYFVEQWQVRNDAQLWLLERHPEMATDRVAAGLSYGKLAFGSAALGRRWESLRFARRALRARPVEPRAWLALLVCCRVLSWQRIVQILNRHGHGI